MMNFLPCLSNLWIVILVCSETICAGVSNVPSKSETITLYILTSKFTLFYVSKIVFIVMTVRSNWLNVWQNNLMPQSAQGS